MKTSIVAAIFLVATGTAYGDEKHESAEAAEAAKNAPALAEALKDVKISLAAGLKAAEGEGTPISGKFEIEDGKLQLSVYTMKGDKLSEVIVDHKTGKVSKSEPIMESDDLMQAKSQAQAMAKTKKSLRSLVARALKDNPGYKAVSVVAEVEDGAPGADVSLLKGSESKQVEEKL